MKPDGKNIPIFAERHKLTPMILRDCGVAIGEQFPIISNWLSVAADELEDKKDTQRLDWLAINHKVNECTSNGDSVGISFNGINNARIGEKIDVRAVIDSNLEKK